MTRRKLPPNLWCSGCRDGTCGLAVGPVGPKGEIHGLGSSRLPNRPNQLSRDESTGVDLDKAKCVDPPAVAENVSDHRSSRPLGESKPGETHRNLHGLLIDDTGGGGRENYRGL